MDVVTVQDPVTGEMIKQLVQNVIDPNTGESIQVPLGLASSDIEEGSAEIVIVHDPLTGTPIQQIVQTKIDPKTGETVKVTSQLPQQKMTKVIDPVTGQPQVVQVMTDPQTGNTIQIPIADTATANLAQSISFLFFALSFPLLFYVQVYLLKHNTLLKMVLFATSKNIETKFCVFFQAMLLLSQILTQDSHNLFK